MLKSMYSGVTGMKNIQTKMDSISNNISNVNTTGFKSGRVRFEDMISQTTANAQGATGNRGGINAQQTGLGVQVGSTDTIMNGGSLQATGRDLDFGIQNGDNSFFIVSGDGTNMQYTRDGGFYTDSQGSLVSASGYTVMGFTAPLAGTFPVLNDGANLDLSPVLGGIKISPTIDSQTAGFGEVNLQSYNIDNSGWVTGTYSDGESYVLGRVALASFTNPNGLEKTGGNMYNATANSGEAVNGGPLDPGYGLIRSGFLEMSNVDLANEFTEMIVASRAYQANSRSITVSDTMLEELINLKR